MAWALRGGKIQQLRGTRVVTNVLVRRGRRWQVSSRVIEKELGERKTPKLKLHLDGHECPKEGGRTELVQ